MAIKVLGDFSVASGVVQLQLPQSRKTRALLAYLAVVNKPQRRERLCELFWEVPDDPRGALRWSLSKLRQIVNADGVERLDADRNFVNLRVDGIELDYDLIRGLSPDAVGALPTDRLERMVSAFTGPFLADLYLPRCSAYEAWRTHCANEAELLHLKALRTLVGRLAGEPERALAHLHALQSLLPDEDFGREIAGINERARLTAAIAPEAAVPRPAAIPAPTTRPAVAPVPEAVAVAPVVPAVLFRQDIRFATAKDGVRIAYAVSGSGPTIVRASHWMSHLEFDAESPVWGHWMEALSEGFTLIRYDGRLNGLSDADCQDLSLDAFVSDLECVVEAAGPERFILLGISQGGAISVEYAARHPERVAGLVLCGAYARGWRARGNAVEIERREAIVTQLRQSWGRDDPVFRQMFTNRFIPGANRVQMDWFNELQRRTLTPENAWRLSNAFADVDVSARLDRLRLPAGIWHARMDRVVPLAEGVELADAIRGSRMHVLGSSNHILLGDEPAFHEFINGAKSFAHEVLHSPAVALVDRRTRRQATILCADFASPHPLDDRFPERAIEIVDPVIMRAVEIVGENGGSVLSITDAELSASFGAPSALEGHAALACRAALAIMDLCAKDLQTGVEARIALDTGVVIVGPSRVGGRDSVEVRGPPVTTCSATAQSLRRNVVAATERTRQSAGGFAAMVALSPGDAAGAPGDQRLYEVREIRHGRSRWHLRAEKQLAPFIGREIQLQLLNRAWHDAAGGEGQTVFVVGDPGLGKSRLTHEFVGAIPDEEAECLETGALETDLRAGLLVIRRLLHGLFDVGAADASALAAEKVKAAQARRGFDERLLTPLLAAMDLPVDDQLWAALSAAERARRVREGVVALILSLAVSRPVVLLVEDLHWIDAESEAILVRLAEALRAGRLLLVATSRPEYDRSRFAEVGPVEVRLPAFTSVETVELLDHILGQTPELERLRTQLAEMCKGNALFIEETVRALGDSGRLAGSPGQYRPQGAIDEIAISANIRSIIDARFDRLAPDAKRLAEVASIFGGEFPSSLVRQLGALPDSRFHEALKALKAADLLIEVQIFPDSILRFKHALIRNAIAARLLTSARIELNRAALAGLKAFHADRIDEHVERLARHALDAEIWDEAVIYLLASAWKAIRRSAHDAALADLDAGIDLLRNHPEISDSERREIEFQLARGVALMAARGWGSEEVLDAFERAEALCESNGDRTRLFSTLRGRAQYYMISGRPAAAQELADRCASIVAENPDPGLCIETDHMFWTNNFFLGNIATAREHAESAIACYDAERDHSLTYVYSGHDPGVCGLCFAGLSAWLAGDPAAARRQCREAVKLAERLQHPLTAALAYWGCGYLHTFAGEAEDAYHWAELELATAERFQFPLLVGQALFQIGWAQFRLGERAVGLRRMEDGIAAIRRTGAEMGLPYLIALRAEALSELGRLEEAAASVREGIELGQRNGTQFQFAEVLTIEALLRERMGAGSRDVEKWLRHAMRVAIGQRSRTGELRAASALAVRLRARGREADADKLMAGFAALLKQLGRDLST